MATDTTAGKGAARDDRPVFTHGATMRHVLVMTATGAGGLMAIFVVELLSVLYISWLKNDALTAGVGYASVLLFVTVSINIGLMIAASGLTARRIGAADRDGARSMAGACLAHIVGISALVVAVILPLVPAIMTALGATGETHAVATRFVLIALPSNVFMALGMGFSGLLRAVGDARRSMNVTLAGGLVTAVVDPLLIFWVGLGVDGAAWGVVVSRLVFALVGYHGAVVVHDMVARPTLALARAETRAIWALAFPAILTNIATPLSLAFVARIISDLGDWAIAANTVNQRIEPVAFGALFALSGAVGPILAQNWGAGMYHRMRAGLRDAFLFSAGYVVITWLVLVLSRDLLVALFQLSGPAAEGVIFFCWISGPLWFFIGLLFSANAAFNNLGFPLYATAFNWGRAILGTAGGAWIGSRIAGFEGALVGVTIGSAAFGVAAAIVAIGTIGRLERQEAAKRPAIAAAARPA